MKDDDGNYRDGPGDGQQRGCAQWVQVGTLEDAVPLPKPTRDECLRLTDEGEAAIEGVGEELKRVEAYLAQPGPVDTWDALWGEMGRVAAAFIDAEPKAERAGACYSFLGQEDAAARANNSAWLYRHYWLELGKECLTLLEFAPAGSGCSRLTTLHPQVPVSSAALRVV